MEDPVGYYHTNQVCSFEIVSWFVSLRKSLEDIFFMLAAKVFISFSWII